MDLGNMTLEEALSHFGTKGMKWGSRKGRTPLQESHARRVRGQRQKKYMKVAAGAIAVGGAVAAVAVLGRNGNLQMNDFVGTPSPRVDALAKAGRDAARVADFNKKAKDLLDDIAKANESDDAYMRSIGLGAVVNNSRF